MVSRTKDRAVTSRKRRESTSAGAADATPTCDPSGWPAPSKAPTRRARPSSRDTLSSTSGTVPARTAATRCSPHGPSGPGITRSSPAVALATVVLVADQSDTTTPRNPHSVLRRSRRRVRFSLMKAPLTELYAAITRKTSASATQASNGGRYSSLSTRSVTRASYVRRSVSESLAT